jgi:hypothetical protein
LRPTTCAQAQSLARVLGYLMYKSGLMPRGLAMLGLIGGPLQSLAGIGVLFDLYDAGGPVQGIATIPEIIWELSLGTQ